MSRITLVVPRRGCRGRMDVYLDGARELTLEAAAAQSLRVGSEAELDSLRAQWFEGEYRAAMERCFTWLDASARTRRELSQKLRLCGFDEDTRERALERLEELGYVNDAQYAQNYAENALRGRSMGAVRQKLRQKGVSTEALDALPPPDEQAELEKAKAVAVKYMGRGGDPRDEKRKASAALARRGFGWEVIRQAIEAVADDDENEPD